MGRTLGTEQKSLRQKEGDFSCRCCCGPSCGQETTAATVWVLLASHPSPREVTPTCQYRLFRRSPQRRHVARTDEGPGTKKLTDRPLRHTLRPKDVRSRYIYVKIGQAWVRLRGRGRGTKQCRLCLPEPYTACFRRAQQQSYTNSFQLFF